MKWMVINGTNDDSNNILLYCRNEKGEKSTIKVLGFEPYFYAPKDEIIDDYNIVSQVPTELTSIYGDKLQKIVTRQPRNVRDIRGKFSKHFEADIPFVRRFLIDQKIFSGFDLPDGKKIVRFDNIKPCGVNFEPRVVLLDIETYSHGRFPKATDKDAKVTVNCLYDSKTKKYLSIAVDPEGKRREVLQIANDHKAIIVKTEGDLMMLTNQFLEVVDPDIVSAWYLPFDKEYLDERAKITKKIEFPWKRTNTFDLLAGYKRLYAKGSNVLADVLVLEKLDVPNYEPFKNEFWEEDLKHAIIVNKSHVESIKILNDKLHLLEFYWQIKSLVGFEDMHSTVYHGMLVDNMTLREFHNKWVLPSKPNTEERDKRKLLKEKKVGGKVLEPPFGIFANVGVFDMSRYYPEMLIAQNLSPEPHKKDELGVYPKITLSLIEARLEYDRKLNELTPGTEAHDQMKFRRNSVKYVTESIIGSFGAESSRVFDLKIFNAVTTMGQRGLMFIQNIMNNEGHKVIYGDTDGASITMPNLETAKAKVSFLNESLKNFCREEGINRELTLKLDRYFEKILFKKVRERVNGVWKERGAKKRYAGHVIFDDGKDVDYLKIVGFEQVRRDASKITKEIQPKVFNLMLRSDKDSVKNYLKDKITHITEGYKSGEVTMDDLAIPKTLSKPLKEYGKLKDGKTIGIPDYVRGSIYCNKWFGTDIRGGDQIKMVYVKKIEGYPKTDVFCYLSSSEIPVKVVVDVEKMLDRTVKGKLEDVVDLIDLKWSDIVSPHKSLFEVLG